MASQHVHKIHMYSNNLLVSKGNHMVYKVSSQPYRVMKLQMYLIEKCNPKTTALGYERKRWEIV